MNFTKRAVEFLRGWQQFVRATEALIIDVISMTIPWAAPLIPAYMAWEAMTHELLFPAWVALAGAAVVELLGLATINTAFEFWSYNQDKRKSDSRAPVFFALMTAAFYLTVILTVNVLLDPGILLHKLAKALLSSLTICGGTIIALRAQHSRRLDAIVQDKQDRRQLRQNKRPTQQETTPSPLPGNGRGSINQSMELVK